MRWFGPLYRPGPLGVRLALLLLAINLAGLGIAIVLSGELPRGIVGLAVVMTLLQAALALLFVDRWIRQPLCRLCTVLERSADGEAITSVPVPVAGQLGRLTRAINLTLRVHSDSETQVRLILEAAADGIITFDEEGVIRSVNRAAARMFGSAPAEMVGREVTAFIPLGRTEEIDIHAVGSGEVRLVGQQQRLEVRRKDGSTFPIEAALSRFRLAGRPIAVAVIHDLSQRQRIDEALRLQALTFANISDAVLLADLDSRLIDFNPAAERLLGYARAEVLGRPLGQLLGPRGPEENGAAAPCGLQADGPRVSEVPFRRKDESEGLCEMTVVPLLDEGGDLLATLCVGRDITRQRRQERHAAVKQEVTRILADAATVAEAGTRLLHRLGECLDCDGGDWWAVDAAANVLRHREGWQRPQAKLEEFLAVSRGLTFAPGEGLPGRVWQQRQPLWIAELSRDACFARHETAAVVGLQSGFGFPVFLGGEFHGVFDFFSRRRQSADVAMLAVLAEAGSQMGQFIERKRAEQQVRLLESAVVHAQDGVMITEAEPIDEPGPRILYVNDAFLRMTGYTREEVLGRSPRFLAGARTDPAELEKLRQAFISWQPVQAEMINYRKDGSEFWIDMNLVPVADETGWFTHWIVVQRDTTARRRSEESLRDSEQRFRSLATLAPVGIFLSDPDGNCVYSNGEYSAITGFSAEQLLGKSWAQVIHPDDLEGVSLAYQQAAAAGRVMHAELRHRRPDGTIVWGDTRCLALSNDQGNVTGYLATVNDVTTRRHEDEERQKLVALIENSTDLIGMSLLDGQCLYINPAGLCLIGAKDLQEARACRVPDFHPPAIATFLREKVFPTVDATGRWQGETQVRDLRTGEEIDVQQSIFLVRDAASGRPLCYATIARDIREAKRAQAELRRRHEELRQLLDSVMAEVWYLDTEARVVRHNRFAEKLTGLSEEQVRGGTAITLAAQWDDPPHRHEQSLAVLRSGEPLLASLESYTVGGEVRWASVDKVPLRDSSGQVNGLLVFIYDITELKRTEAALREAKDAAEAANRAKSAFLANVSHEIRTPMNGILGMTELLLDLPVTAEQRDYLGLVRSSAETLLTIIDDLLDFSRIEAGKLPLEARDFELRDVLGETLRALAVRAEKKGLRLRCHVAGDVPAHLTGDATRLRQIIVNLVGNAIKFTEHGEVSIIVQIATSPPDTLPPATCLLQFSVQDTGIGIPVEKRQAIFDPFEQVDATTTTRYGGTGLGLAIVARLTQLMGGRVWVDSAPGEGSTFHFTARFGVPAVGAVAAPVAEKPAVRTTPAGRPRRILLVEDNQVNQVIASRLLARRGDEVVLAGTGPEALAALDAQTFDLVLMDVQMPGMDGFEVTARIRRREQGTGRHLPIVAMTAYAMKGDRERCLAAGMDDYLGKPVRPEILYQVIDRATGIVSPPAPTPTTDFDAAALLGRMSGDQALAREVVRLFLERSPVLLAEIGAAVERQDAAALLRAAHTFKGMVSYLSAEAAEQAQTLESMGRIGDTTGAGGVWHALEANVQRLQPTLEELVSREE